LPEYSAAHAASRGREHDTKKAVEELYSKGVLSDCLTLDPNADDYVKRLPEMLPTLFASLTAWQ